MFLPVVIPNLRSFPNPMIEALIAFLIVAIIVAAIAGLFVYLVRSAPFIGSPFKEWIVWGIIAVACLTLILKLLPLAGVSI
jgi:cation transporter-like permease